jgi:hypothetical protein
MSNPCDNHWYPKRHLGRSNFGKKLNEAFAINETKMILVSTPLLLRSKVLYMRKLEIPI